MKSGSLTYLSFDYHFPAKEPPAWASRVERWYQLDAAAFGLPHAFHHWHSSGLIEGPPEFLILASPDGSNQTDYDFALALKASGAPSPSKFVHTLPNSRSSALLQVMNHGGPMICVQNDPATLISGLALAMTRTAFEGSSRTWVLGVTNRDRDAYRCHFFELQRVLKAASFSWRQRQKGANDRPLKPTDSELVAWLAKPAPDLAISDFWEILFAEKGSSTCNRET